jgi:integrase
MRKRLTRAVLDGAERPATGDIRIQDADVPALTARITSTGAVRFFVYYRMNGQQRRPKIGEWPTMSIERARQIARDTVSDAHSGVDLSKRRTAARTAPTVADHMKAYLEEYARPYKAPSSAYNDMLNINRHIVPALGRMRVSEVASRDIQRLLAKIGQTAPVQANRVGALLSKAFSLAEEWGARDKGTNPAARYRRQPEPERQMALDSAALARLAEALARAEQIGAHHRLTADLVRLLVLTGARRDELRLATVDRLDKERRRLRVPENKEKNPNKALILGPSAWAICARLALASPSGWLFPSLRHRDGPMAPPRRPWAAIKRMARLPDDLHLHDLRHTYASAALALGYSLDQIGGLLGHSDPNTTKEYAYLLDDPKQQAVAAIDGAVGQIIVKKNNIFQN